MGHSGSKRIDSDKIEELTGKGETYCKKALKDYNVLDLNGNDDIPSSSTHIEKVLKIPENLRQIHLSNFKSKDKRHVALRAVSRSNPPKKERWMDKIKSKFLTNYKESFRTWLKLDQTTIIQDDTIFMTKIFRRMDLCVLTLLDCKMPSGNDTSSFMDEAMSLQRLEVKGTELDKPCTTAILRLIHRVKLKELTLVNCGLAAEQCRQIVDACIAKDNRMKLLDLSENPIDEPTAARISLFMMSKNVSRLKLLSCEIDDDSLDLIEKFAKKSGTKLEIFPTDSKEKRISERQGFNPQTQRSEEPQAVTHRSAEASTSALLTHGSAFPENVSSNDMDPRKVEENEEITPAERHSGGSIAMPSPQLKPKYEVYNCTLSVETHAYSTRSVRIDILKDCAYDKGQKCTFKDIPIKIEKGRSYVVSLPCHEHISTVTITPDKSEFSETEIDGSKEVICFLVEYSGDSRVTKHHLTIKDASEKTIIDAVFPLEWASPPPIANLTQPVTINNHNSNGTTSKDHIYAKNVARDTAKITTTEHGTTSLCQGGY